MTSSDRPRSPRPLSDAGMERMRRWAGRKPRFALMGEFSAGKSTLLNFLIGQEFAPTRVTATQVPAVWLSYGRDDSASMFDQNGARTRIDRDDIYTKTLDDCLMLRFEIERDGLREYDIIDTPGISDPLMKKDTLSLVSRYCNAVLWCTHANQAWRQSESATWKALPDRLRRNSILVVTRADRLSWEDAQRVRARLEREAQGLFREIVFIATPLAVRAEPFRGTGDGAQAWSDSGGEGFYAAMDNAIAAVGDERAAMLGRYAPDTV